MQVLQMTEMDMPSGCFIQIAYDEFWKFLIIELPDIEIISNPFIKLINIIYLQILCGYFPGGIRFLTVTKFLRNKQLLYHNID